MWDEVHECRAWCHPENGAPDGLNGEDYFDSFVANNKQEPCLDATRST